MEKKYFYPAPTKLSLSSLLTKGGFSEAQLMASVKNYFQQTENKWRKSPRYFFATSKDSKSYHMFEGFTPSAEKLEESKKKVDVEESLNF